MNSEITGTQIINIKLGMNNCYLIKEDGLILVDAGVPKKIKAFEKQLAKHSISPGDIKLIVVTHAHFDHMGSLADIAELTKAKVAVHKYDKTIMVKGRSDVPRGNTLWGKISMAIFKPFLKNIVVPGVIPDITIEEENFSLKPFGINGKIIHTPGHTMGSISVILDSGDAFVGCMVHNRLPFTIKPKFPIYANHPNLLDDSWLTILREGATTIYPGHGKPFHSGKIEVKQN